VSNVSTTVTCARVPVGAWSRPSLVGAPGYPLAVPAAAFAKHAQKRSAMDRNDIDGWPPGPQEGTST
jgi:hypothetical protein